MDDLSFGQRLVHYRTRLKMLQRELAEKIGISPTALNYYEKDKREPNVLTIKLLAEALGVTGNELLGIPSRKTRTEANGDDEIALLSNYRLLSDQGKEWIRQSMSMAVQTYKKDHSFSNLETSEEIS